MKIIVGLGNPGFRYKRTKHNVGFMVLDLFAKEHGIRLKNKGFGGLYGIGRICGEETLLFKPLTYMNLSGGAVEAVSLSKLDKTDSLLVVSDEYNLPLGVIRLREKGSAGGHNGLQSIIERIGVDFNRLRVGVGSENMPEDKARYVLSPFVRAERRVLDETVKRAMESIESWIKSGIKETMEKYNGTTDSGAS